MKKFIDWLGGFFSSESNNSSKRLVGIIGAMFLFWTLWAEKSPSETLVYCVTTLVAVSLGLTTIESVAHIVKSFKNGGSEEPKQ